MSPHVVAGIFARGGSKGVPRKNLRPLGGRPLIAHAVEVARACRAVTRVFVSTDDPEIARAAEAAGAEVPFLRPSALAQDDSPEWLAWQHAIRTLRPADPRPWDAFVAVPTTSPLRIPEDVDRCIDALLGSDADVALTVRPAERSPYFNMVTIDDGGRARLVLPGPDGGIARRQDAPRVWDITTVAYAARPDFVLRAGAMFDGTVTASIVPAERALDIDTEFDFTVAELLWRHREGTRP